MDQVERPGLRGPRPVEETLRDSVADLQAGRWEDGDAVLARIDRMIADYAAEKAKQQAD